MDTRGIQCGSIEQKGPPVPAAEQAVEPPDAVGAELTAIWRALLKDDSLGADSDFRDHGGTSLTAVRIRSRIRLRLNRDVQLIDILENPTPRQLETVVSAAGRWRPGEPAT
jgi:hypothetical protein